MTSLSFLHGEFCVAAIGREVEATLTKCVSDSSARDGRLSFYHPPTKVWIRSLSPSLSLREELSGQ